MTTPQPAPPIAQPEPEIARAQLIAWVGGGLLKVLNDIARAYQEAERAEHARKEEAA
jgi:hypothetical protein